MTYYGDKAPQLVASIITLAVIAYVLFGLRVYTRLRNAAWGMDDWCMSAAIVGIAALHWLWYADRSRYLSQH